MGGFRSVASNRSLMYIQLQLQYYIQQRQRARSGAFRACRMCLQRKVQIQSARSETGRERGQNKRPVQKQRKERCGTSHIHPPSYVHSHRFASVHITFVSAYDAHRVSRRHLGFGRFLPWIEGPVLVAVRGWVKPNRKKQGNKSNPRKNKNKK